jgi:Acetyltransferase (GNAT) domain
VTGWFAEELAGEVEEAGYRCWVATEDDRVVGFADGLPTHPPDPCRRLVRPGPGGGRPGRRLLERLLAEAGAGRAWLITHDLDIPARARYRSLGFQELGHGPLGWHDADRVALGAELPQPG